MAILTRLEYGHYDEHDDFYSVTGVRHIFSCDRCGLERKWGWTTVQTPNDEVRRPLLDCEACGPARDHTFKRYQ